MNEIKLSGLKERQLLDLSRKMLLSLNAEEMKTVQAHFKKKKREPSQLELETIAQTWSEHCKHKTFNAEISFNENGKKKRIVSLFNTYIRKATEKAAKKKKGFLVSVFHDNAGIIRFNETHNIAFKVETHNHPSALDPYGGANTGVGGVIRDVLGVGLGAKPIANTDVFCFAPHDFPAEKVPKGILHPKRIFKGVRSGVRDYGNRMGIPTVNGAIFFDEKYLGNPLVYCGTIGLIPRGFEKKEAKEGDLIIVVGGRTGRDGIHGATFSSIELDESTSSSAVQIGNAIEERKVMDVLLDARDKKLYSAITDCGAGGFSSAVGEMGKDLGAEVWLEKAPLKYKGLLPWEIWLSESQERMVLAVPPKNERALIDLFAAEDVEATVIGRFTGNKKFRLFFEKELVGELESNFLHKGVPRKKMNAKWTAVEEKPIELREPKNLGAALLSLLAHPNIASKESTVRQYDHEVQGGAILKPFVGVENDGPSDAAIVRPLLGGNEAVAISNGLNPFYGETDAYLMACSAIDEALRNLIAVGGSLDSAALLDNFCWGNPEKEEKLGELVRAAKGCFDAATAFNVPFISGKDSFYNEFSIRGETISIPPTLLISAFSAMPDFRKRVSMDLKEKGNPVYIVGETFKELGASHYAKISGATGGFVPKVRFEKAKKSFEKLSKAIFVGVKFSERIVCACHDCSEGGIGVAAAEMAFAGGIGIEIDLRKIPLGEKISRNDFILFSESNSRFIVEVNRKKAAAFEKIMKGSAFALIGRTAASKELTVTGLNGKKVLNERLSALKKAWKRTLGW
ncbi:MAG: phosphoribosylformylglycinamidine synthase subunit PurL [Candidatus Diapherotrites archaeon]